uniref:Uncharacterized protein n=1 Tax=Anopheles coluzzii TaxID=1518534 RepID=A0A8W7Q0E5_ANOCL
MKITYTMYPNGEFGWSSGKPLSGTGSTSGVSIIDRASPLAELRSDSSNMSTELPQMEDSSRQSSEVPLSRWSVGADTGGFLRNRPNVLSTTSRSSSPKVSILSMAKLELLSWNL